MSEEVGTLPIDDTKLLDPGTDVFSPDDMVFDKKATQDVPVSPFGLGPYPGIPDDFPEPDIFESLASMGDSDMRKALELQKRLIVKFWKQGNHLKTWVLQVMQTVKSTSYILMLFMSREIIGQTRMALHIDTPV